MQKRTRKVLKSFISMFIVIAMILTSIPSTWLQVSAASNKQVGAVKLNTTSKTVCIGDTYTFGLLNKPSGAKITWSSSKTKVATVNTNGVVKAKATGSTEIKCKVKTNRKTVVLKAKVKVSNTITVSTQKQLNNALKAKNAKTITIKTKSDVELTIPKGKYTSKKLVVNAPKATITNYGVFNTITIQSIKPYTWIEKAVGNTIKFLCNASVIVEKSADANISIDKANIEVICTLYGTVNLSLNKKCDITIEGSKDSNVKIKAKVEANIKTAIPIVIDATKKISLELTTSEATTTTVKVTDEKVLPDVKGGSIKVVTETGKEIVVEDKKIDTTTNNTSTSSGTSSADGNESSSDGLDSQGRIVANFGAPDEIDGIIDDAWKNATPVKFRNYSYGDKKTDTSAILKVLWDDNAIYFLAEVKDSEKSLQPANVYEKDSVEFFLDQDNKRSGNYDPDDSQFRINYMNEQSCDHGDLTNCYTAASETKDGYVIEGRVSLSKAYVTPANNVCMGIEAQLNDAVGASRAGTISIFDKTGTAYQDTSKFGEVILLGKTATSVTKPSSYDLRALVAGAEKIELERYANGDAVANLITESKAAIADTTTTQEAYDTLLANLNTALDALVHDKTTSFDEKECRDIPKRYKTTDTYQGTLDFVRYDTERFDKPGENYTKNMMVYLPYGYNPDDTTKKYNVLYLVHGMAESEFTPFGVPGSNNELMKIVDNLIADGKMEPMIIACPTWYYEKDAGMGDLDTLVKNFSTELQRDILPLVESKYHTYATITNEDKAADQASLKATRNHRAFGGFSMGGNCTWYQYEQSFEYFQYFIPVSMWSWLSHNVEYLKEQGATGEDGNALVASYFAKIANDHPDMKFNIFAATGTADLAYPGMPNQIDAFKAAGTPFNFSADLSKGNCYFILMPGGAHNWTCVNQYLYNILPDLFVDNGNGLDEEGRVVANFGSPEDIDGIVDEVWDSAQPVKLKNYSYGGKKSATSATLKVLWDDRAVYFLADVKDYTKSLAPANVYEKDSVEFFLDPDNKGTGNYDPDDSQFRINYRNEQSCDHGDLTNCYTAARETDNGYIIEGRVALPKDITPDNDTIMGIEAQLNDAVGGTRAGTISIFDTTGNAYQNTSLFGKLILTGKGSDSVTKPSSYDLRSLVASANKILLDRYSNGNDVQALIESSEAAMVDANSTQETFDNLLVELNAAIDNLESDGEYYPDMECRDIPKKYKTTDPIEQQGSLVLENYTVKRFDNGENFDKSMVVYLPNGYNADDELTKYNVLYLVHGMAENQFTPFGYPFPGQNNELMKIVDNLIADGKMEPMIIVSPTWYYETDAGMGELDALVKNFSKELQNDIIPLIEKKYHTYATVTGVDQKADKASIIATRDHRAFGGFSMGGNCTWYQFEQSFKYFKYFVPVSMWSWLSNNPQALVDEYGAVAKNGKDNNNNYANEVVANYFTMIPALNSDETKVYTKDDFHIFGATGTADLACPGMPNQIDALIGENETFHKPSPETGAGNIDFILMEGGAHNWTCVNQYLYNYLPCLFK